MSQLRFDPTTQQWTIIAPERCKYLKKDLEHKDLERPCPFCPGNEAMAPGEIYRISPKKQENSWDCRVIPNNYPVLRVEESLEREANGIFDSIRGVGAHEVIIDSPEHNLTINKYSQEIWTNLFEAICSRIKDLKNDIRLRYVVVFKDTCKKKSSTTHPHSQIIALPEIPPTVKQLLHTATDYYLQKERCIYCDLMNQEISENLRIVCENKDFLAICPYASSFPFEVRIYPKKHGSDFSELDQKQKNELADITSQVCYRMFQALEQPDVNISIHSAPIANDPLTTVEFGQWMNFAYHWHMIITPTIPVEGNLETFAGVFVNTVRPEDAAAFLRKIK